MGEKRGMNWYIKLIFDEKRKFFECCTAGIIEDFSEKVNRFFILLFCEGRRREIRMIMDVYNKTHRHYENDERIKERNN